MVIIAETGPVQMRFSERSDGDFAIGAPSAALDAQRSGLFGSGTWTWLRQVHGSTVVQVDEPGAHAGVEADAAVTATRGVVLAINTADCLPVLLHDRVAGVVGAAHAGWRGAVAGVLETTVEAMRSLGATDVAAHIGPHIRARCYEFSAPDLGAVVERCGPAAVSETAWGTPALDLTAVVRVLLGRVGVAVHDVGGCTACEPERLYSHRARGDVGRAASVISIDAGELS